MKYKTEGLNELSKQFHKFQIDAGFTDRSITQRLMLVHSEVSEAFEAFRKDKYTTERKMRLFESDHNEKWERKSHDSFSFESNIKDTFEDELADSIIRLLAICAENNVDIEKHIQYKMEYNELRGFKYGGKKF